MKYVLVSLAEAAKLDWSGAEKLSLIIGHLIPIEIVPTNLSIFFSPPDYFNIKIKLGKL